MWGAFFKLPSVISGNSGKLLPPSVARAATPSLGLRDRLRIARGGKVPSSVGKAISMSMGKVGIGSARSTLTAPISGLKRLKFW
jgi:hypothetical protein